MSGCSNKGSCRNHAGEVALWYLSEVHQACEAQSPEVGAMHEVDTDTDSSPSATRIAMLLPNFDPVQ